MIIVVDCKHQQHTHSTKSHKHIDKHGVRQKGMFHDNTSNENQRERETEGERKKGIVYCVNRWHSCFYSGIYLKTKQN